MNKVKPNRKVTAAFALLFSAILLLTVTWLMSKKAFADNSEQTIAQTAQYFDLQKDFKRSYKTPTSGDATETTTLWFRWSPDITVNEAKLGTFNASSNYGAQGAESLVLAAADEANGVAAKTAGDYLELGVQRSGESEITQKSFNAWKSDAPIGEAGKTPTMRIDVFQNYVGIYVNDWSFTRDDIKTLTIKQGFMPVEVKKTSANKNPDNRGNSWYAPAEIKSGGLKTDYALPADITFNVNDGTRRLECAAKRITVDTMPNKVSYIVGEKMETAADGSKSKADLEGLTATATLSDDSIHPLIANDLARNYSYDPFDSAGEKAVTCYYGGASVSFNVTVKNPTAYSESQAKLDLTRSFEREAGEVGNFGAVSSTIWFDWKGDAAAAQSTPAKNSWVAQKIACGQDGKTFGDYIVLEKNDGTSKTFNEWAAEGQVKRIIVYGQRIGINIDDVGALRRTEIKTVTLKEGLAPIIVGTDTWGNDGAGGDTGSIDAALALKKDVVLYINHTKKVFEHYYPTLTITAMPQKTEFVQNAQFDLTDAQDIQVKAILDGEEFMLSANDMTFSADFSEAGASQVTVSYGGASVQYGVTVTAPAKTLSSISADFTITANRFAMPNQFSVPENAKITAVYSDQSSETIDFALSMLGDTSAGKIDTTTAGEYTLTVSYTYLGVTRTCSVPFTVSETTQATAIKEIEYGQSGKAGVENGRKLPVVLEDGFPMKVVYGQESYPSMVPGKTNAQLIHIKFKNNATVFDLTACVGARLRAFGAGNIYLLPLDTWVLNDSLGSIEYIRLDAGLLLYNDDTDNQDDHATTHYPAVNNGKYAYLDHDVYFTYTSDLVEENYGTIEKPYTNLTIKLAEGAVTEYYPGEELDLSCVTYEADYLDPAESGKATGTVTAEMCSSVPDMAGSANITVRVHGASATFAITVLAAEKKPQSIALQAPALLTYDKYSLEPTMAENCMLVVTYDDETTAEVLMQKEWIVARPDTSVSGDTTITIAYKQFGKTVTVTETVKVLDREVNSNLSSVDYGAADMLPGWNHLRVAFVVDGGNDAHYKAIGNIGGLPAVQSNITLADLIMIKFTGETEVKSLAEWNELFGADNHIVPAFYGKTSITFMDTDKVPSIYGSMEYVIIKAGFIWYTANADAYSQTGNASAYFPIAENIVTSDMYAGFFAGAIVKPVQSISVNLPQGFKTEYYAGEPLSTDGVTLTVKYVDPKSTDETIPLTEAMCGDIVGDETSAEVMLSYMGKTVTVSGLKLTPYHIGGIVIKTQGKTQYSFAAEDFDASGYEVEMVILDADNIEVKREIVDPAALTVIGYDSHTLGIQIVKFSYAGNETETFEIETVNDQRDKYLSIDYVSSYASYENTTLDAMVVHSGLVGIPSVQFATLGRANDLPNVADKILINGKLASDLIADGTLAEIRFWTDQICFFFNTDRMQATRNPTGGHGSYTEGVTELVETVTFLPGFQLYFCSDNYWDGSWKESDVTAIKHGVVKEKITLVNIGEGMGWMRELKKSEDGKTDAPDAVTIGSLPVKTTFSVGDKVTASDFMAGLKLHFKYSDGGEEDIAPSLADIEFDPDITDTAGKKTVTVYFKDNDHYATFEITVTEKSAEEPGNGCSSCGGTISSVSSGIGALLLLAAAFLIVRSKKESKR